MECGSCDGPLSMQLLYSVICKEAPAVEHEEIKRVLGANMVEENEAIFCMFKDAIKQPRISASLCCDAD